MRIRLLYFCSDYQVGLTQAQTEQVEHLAKESQIELFCVSSEKEQEPGLHERLKRANVNLSIIRDLDVHANAKGLCNQIADIVDRNHITHINVHNNWQLGLIARLKLNLVKRRNFKTIYTIHGYRHNHPVKSIIAIATIGAALLLFADRVISMSKYVSKRFWFLSYKIDRVFYMMNKPEYMKKENIIDTTNLSMVFPAQFRKGKRQEILLNALKIYVEKTGDKNAQLHLPGSGPLLESMKKLSYELGISNQVYFYGKLSLNEVISIYEENNIALCSSNVETYGRCIAEPFMLGRCVITQKTGVATDIIKDTENGFFFSDANNLSEILISLKNSPHMIKQVANKAFADRDIFFPEKVMQTYIAAISKA